VYALGPSRCSPPCPLGCRCSLACAGHAAAVHADRGWQAAAQQRHQRRHGRCQDACGSARVATDEKPVATRAGKRARLELTVEAYLEGESSNCVFVDAEPSNTVARLRFLLMHELELTVAQVGESLHLEATGSELPADAILRDVLEDGAVAVVKRAASPPAAVASSLASDPLAELVAAFTAKVRVHAAPCASSSCLSRRIPDAWLAAAARSMLTRLALPRFVALAGSQASASHPQRWCERCRRRGQHCC